MSLLSDIILQTHAISQRVEAEKSTSLDNGVNLSPKEQAKSLAAKHRVSFLLRTQALVIDLRADLRILGHPSLGEHHSESECESGEL